MSDDLREFVDTNVLLYAYDLAAGMKRGRAAALLDRLWETRTGALSTQVLQEFYINATRKIGNPLPPAAAEQIIANFGEWTAHAPRVEDVVEAIRIHRKHKISFWDAMIIRSACELGCAVLWSEDLSANRDYEGVQVRNPLVG